MQPPCSRARSRTTSRASGIRSRSALVVLVWPWVTRHPERLIQLGRGVAAPAALPPDWRQAVIEQDQVIAARRAGLVSPPRGCDGHAASPPVSAARETAFVLFMARMSSSETNAARTRTGSG